MKKESSKLENNHALASAVLVHFQLTPEEIRLLQGTPKDLTVEDGFYTALDKLKKIHDDCKYLVSHFGHWSRMRTPCNLLPIHGPKSLLPAVSATA